MDSFFGKEPANAFEAADQVCDVSRAAYQLRKKLQQGKETKMLESVRKMEDVAGTACLQMLVIDKDNNAWRGRYAKAKRDILAVGTNTKHDVTQTA
jgi:4-hydroxyphenylpyruvate dioxygenase-like putative hemolysin